MKKTRKVLTPAGVKKIEAVLGSLTGGPLMSQVPQADVEAPVQALTDEFAALQARGVSLAAEARDGLIERAEAEAVGAKLLARQAVITAALRLRAEGARGQ